jgi:dihydropyrimidinase
VFDVLIVDGTVVSAEGTQLSNVAVTGETIVDVGPHLESSQARTTVDARGCLVFPGIIDSHNHPYYYDDIEAFSLAAAYGGVTTLLSFAGKPLNSPVDDVVEMVDAFISDGEARSYLDFGLHVILTPADPLERVVPALLARGVTSFKVFMAFAKQQRMMPDDRILDLMQRVADAGGICMVHCENGPAIEFLESQMQTAGKTSMADYIASRPAPLESEAVYRALALAEVANCEVYIVHISAKESVALIDRYRYRSGSKRFAETCPHYLVLIDADQARLGGRAKISPPMRTAMDRDALWKYIAEGKVDVVASDCSGQTCQAKLHGAPDAFAIASGIPGVDQLFSIVYDEAVNARHLPPSLLAKLFCKRPAEIFCLTRKGVIAPGYDADLLVFDPDVRWTIGTEEVKGNSDYSIYEGRELLGKPKFSMQRGRTILSNGKVVAHSGDGRYLPRSGRVAQRSE